MALVLLAWGGNIIGSYWHVAIARDRLNVYLASCPPQELRISVVFAGSNGDQLVTAEETVDFVGARATHTRHVDFVSPFHSFFVQFMPPTNVDFSIPSPVSPDQLLRVERALVLMKKPTDSTLEPFRDRWHMAFWQDHQLHIYHFSREETAKVQAVVREAQLDATLEVWSDRSQNAPSGD